MSSVGSPTAVSTSSIVTSPALGTLAAPTLARVAVKLTVMTSPASRLIPFIWAMKMAATASYRAVPSMLMVAPTGSTNRVTRLSIPLFSSRFLKVTGRVAVLKQKQMNQSFPAKNHQFVDGKEAHLQLLHWLSSHIDGSLTQMSHKVGDLHVLSYA